MTSQHFPTVTRAVLETFEFVCPQAGALGVARWRPTFAQSHFAWLADRDTFAFKAR